MTETRVAYEAMELGRKNEHAIAAHEDLCSERYKHINESIAGLSGGFSKSVDEIKNILKWAGTTGFGMIIALLAWSISQQIGANDAARRAADTKIELLMRQGSNSTPAR